MASVASSGASPHSPYELVPDTNEQEGEWDGFLQANSGPSSIGWHTSPGSGSMASGYAVIGYTGQQEFIIPSPPAPSPLNLDTLQAQPSMPPSTFAEQFSPFNLTSAPTSFDGAFVPTPLDTSAPLDFIPQDVLSDEEFNALLLSTNTMPLASPLAGLENMSNPLPSPALQIPETIPVADLQGSPWDSVAIKSEPLFVMDGYVSPSPPLQNSTSVSPVQARSPVVMPTFIKQSGSPTKPLDVVIRTKRPGNRVEKKKAPSNSPKYSSSSESDPFRNLLQTNINTEKPNAFECFEAIGRQSQKGRKGPLADETKQNALQVRRKGACFCCHARKVKCDQERPCKNCVKLCTQVPGVVCWQFGDFLTVLFPDIIRDHFRKEAMAKFVSESIDAFLVDGEERPCEVSLFSGRHFKSTLTVKAKFFTPKNEDVQQHYALQKQGGQTTLQDNGTVSIGIDTEGTAQREELRRKVKEYLQQLVAEPLYAEQLTDSHHHTLLPRTILRLVQDYYQRTQSPIVYKALYLVAAQFVMSRMLCLSQQSIHNLKWTNMVPQDNPFLTARVLARQIKAVTDEILQKGMTELFDMFTKSLKPKLRNEWAPCLAAFLVVCLFMESTETTADMFVTMENEIQLRKGLATAFDRSPALKINEEIEQTPFKQFAFQFHHVYQTHSKDVASKGFNPLVDDWPIEQGDLDTAAVQLVMMLRTLIEQPNWNELHNLSQTSLPNNERYPFLEDPAINYAGKLVATFLLSFTDETYIFGPSA